MTHRGLSESSLVISLSKIGIKIKRKCSTFFFKITKLINLFGLLTNFAPVSFFLSRGLRIVFLNAVFLTWCPELEEDFQQPETQH